MGFGTSRVMQLLYEPLVFVNSEFRVLDMEDCDSVITLLLGLIVE